MKGARVYDAIIIRIFCAAVTVMTVVVDVVVVGVVFIFLCVIFHSFIVKLCGFISSCSWLLFVCI